MCCIEKNDNKIKIILFGGEEYNHKPLLFSFIELLISYKKLELNLNKNESEKNIIINEKKLNNINVNFINGNPGNFNKKFYESNCLQSFGFNFLKNINNEKMIVIFGGKYEHDRYEYKEWPDRLFLYNYDKNEFNINLDIEYTV